MSRLNKNLFVFILVVLIFTTSSFQVFASNDVSVYIDGNKVEFDVEPIVVDGRTLVPMRAIFEKLGAIVYWDNSTSTAIAQNGNINVSMAIGDAALYKNGKAITLDVPSQVREGRTMVPLRAVSEAFECEVSWDGNNRKVDIYNNSNLTPKEEAVKTLRNWLSDYTYSFTGVDENVGYHFQKGMTNLAISPVKNSNDISIMYSTWTAKKHTYCVIYLLKSEFTGVYADEAYSTLNGYIPKSTSQDNTKLEYNYSKCNFEHDKEMVTSNFRETFDDTLNIFGNFLKEKDIGLALEDFDLKCVQTVMMLDQNIAFNNLKDFVDVKQNNIINDNPAYVQLSKETKGSKQYSIEYNGTNEVIRLTLEKVFEGSRTYSNIDLTPNGKSYHCSFSFFYPNNKSKTPDFSGTYIIDAKTFGEEYDISFENIKGSKKNMDIYPELAKMMDIELLHFSDFIFTNSLKSFGCSIADFGFEFKK